MVKTLVIKVGGAFLEADEKAQALFSYIRQLQNRYQVLLVHGGGAMVEELFNKLQLTTEKKDGLRVTPDAHMPYVVAALAGTANKKLVSLAIKGGVNPVGLCLADGEMTESQAISDTLGAVGQAVGKNPNLLKLLMEKQFLPIVSSIGADADGRLLNINADDAATSIAQLLNAELILLSDVPGVLDDEKQLLSQLNQAKIDELIASNVIRDGMQVKVKAALAAANSIGQPVTIGGWQEPDALLNLLVAKPFGTQILPESP